MIKTNKFYSNEFDLDSSTLKLNDMLKTFVLNIWMIFNFDISEIEMSYIE